MSDPPPPAADPTSDDPPPGASPASQPASSRPQPARHRLDRRTVGICVCVALLAALLAGLIANAARSDDGHAQDRSPRGTLTKINPHGPTSVPTDPVERLTTGTFSLADFKGQPVVLNFFSSTCAPCVKEMPGLEQLHQQLGDKVAFVGIDVQDTKAEGQRLVQRTGVTYEIGYDAQANLLRAVDGKVLPTTALVAPDGGVVTVHSAGITPGDLRQLLVDQQLLAPA